MSEQCFDNQHVTRLIALGKPKEEILPLFVPLIKLIINSGLAYDSRNLDEDDLVQCGLLKASEIIDKFNPKEGNLFHYSSLLIRHALWAEVKLKPLDKIRSVEEVDFDAQAGEDQDFGDGDKVQSLVTQQLLKSFRVEDENCGKAARYVVGVFQSNLYDSNRARVLKTLTHGYGVNPKQSRYITDEVLVKLRVQSGRPVQPVRDDKLFYNRFKYTLIPELRELIGERGFERLMHYFGGVTISVPSQEQMDWIDRDLAILRAMSHDWTCGPSLAKKYNISPEGIKAVFKTCLHRLQVDEEYRDLVSKYLDLNKVPGYSNPAQKNPKKKPMPNFGERKPMPKRRVNTTDSMGFKLGSRNSLIYTLILTKKCTREDLINMVLEKHKGTREAARATVSSFLSDIKHPFGKFNTSRNLQVVSGPGGILSFTPESLKAAQQIIAEKRRQALALLAEQEEAS